MRLLELRANQPSFKSIRFNPEGLSLIVGGKSDQESTDTQMTYNGVGKSLIVSLIYYCLGFSKNKSFSQKLPDWAFELEFEIDHVRHVARREVMNHESVILDGKPFKLKEFDNWMSERLFSIPKEIPELNYKALFKRFIRKGKSAYVDCLQYDPKEIESVQLLHNLYLLGYDPSLIIEKAKLKKEINANSNLIDLYSRELNIEKDHEPIDIKMADLKDRIAKLEQAVVAFRIGENLSEQQRTAKEIRNQLILANNEILLREQAIAQIEKSLEVKSDLSLETIQKMYREAGFFFSERELKPLAEVEQFHLTFIARRQERLMKERARFQFELKDFREKAEGYQKELDRVMKYLGSHGPLEDYSKLHAELEEKKARLSVFHDYLNKKERAREQQAKLKEQLSHENMKAYQYQSNVEDLKERNLALFRSISKKLYHSKPGGIGVVLNTGLNQKRFDLTVKLEDDKSDGINEAKMYCFDMTLLLARHEHNMNFLFHDSRLFSDMDPRQRITILKHSHELGIIHGNQYIASLNEDMLFKMEPYLTAESKGLLEEQIVLRLTDESDEARLLGIHVELDYDE